MQERKKIKKEMFIKNKGRKRGTHSHVENEVSYLDRYTIHHTATCAVAKQHSGASDAVPFVVILHSTWKESDLIKSL